MDLKKAITILLLAGFAIITYNEYKKIKDANKVKLQGK